MAKKSAEFRIGFWSADYRATCSVDVSHSKAIFIQVVRSIEHLLIVR